jgi:ketosteroid isomerase-like protein
MSTTEATLVAIERFNDAFNQHDVDGLTRLMTDDVEARIQTDGEVAGPGGNRSLL